MVSVIELRRHVVLPEADALADHEGADEAGDAGVDVHDGAAGEVDRAEAEDQAGRSGSSPPQTQTMWAIGQ